MRLLSIFLCAFGALAVDSSSKLTMNDYQSVIDDINLQKS